MKFEMQLFENEGAIYRGIFRSCPLEIWNKKEQAWEPYTGYKPKFEEWGYPISEEEAKNYMG
jgi:hypothetical protein